MYVINTQYYCVNGLVLDNVCIHYSKPFFSDVYRTLNACKCTKKVVFFFIQSYNLEFENRRIQQCFKRSFSDRHDYSLKS